MDSWINAQEVKQKMCKRQAPTPIESWTKPSLGRYKCNVDAFFLESLDWVGIGICIRDEEGGFVLAQTKWFSPMLEVDVGKALGLLKAMELVKDIHLWNMDFKVDSKTVVDSIYDKYGGVSEFSEITNSCKRLLGTDPSNSHVKFVRRQANVVAHNLARAAPLKASFRIHYKRNALSLLC